MQLGKRVAESMFTNPMAPFTRLLTIEHEFACVHDGVPLLGFADTFTWNEAEKTATIGEYKVGMLENEWGNPAWSQAKAEKHGQLRFYSLCVWTQYGIPPERQKIFLEWKPVVFNPCDGYVLSPNHPIQHFDVTLTSAEVLRFAKSVKRMWAAMQEYEQARTEMLFGEWKPELSTSPDE
jgi:hypothetical protein